MTPDSKRKEKAARGKKDDLRRWIVDWTIEPTITPGYVSLSLFVAGASDDSVCSSTTRRYLLRQDRIVELIRELTGTLEHSDASMLLEGQALAVEPDLSTAPGSAADMAEERQQDLLSSHFSLGAYGLVGN
jgi:hypothetical protein